MNKTLFTIAIPTVKYTFLRESIESALIQSYDNIEILILNNADKEIDKQKIKEICLSFKDYRIRYFENDVQLPMVKNWNRVLSKAKGEYFTILCDDDKFHPDFLMEIHLLITKYINPSLFHSRIIAIDENGNELHLSTLCPEFEDGLDFIYHRISGFRSTFLSDFVVKTSDLVSIGGFTELPDGWGSDDITWFKLALKNGVAYTAKPLVYYRHSPSNASNYSPIKNKIIAIDSQFNEIQDIIRNLKNPDTLIVEMIRQQLLIFKDTRKYPFWVKKINKSYKIPIPIAKFIAYVVRYVVRKKQLRIYHNNNSKKTLIIF